MGKFLTEWRKVASIVWSKPSDPTIYGIFELDASGIEKFIKMKREQTGVRITITHVIGKAVADTFAKLPHFNVMLKRGKFVQRETIDIFFQVEFSEGQLAGVKIKEADKKSIEEIAQELTTKAREFKEGKERKMTRVIKVFSLLPSGISQIFAKFAHILSYEFSIALPGLESDPFGTAMVTNIATFDLEVGFAPLFPISRTPLVITVGKVRKKPIVEDEKVVPKPVLTLGITADHRYYDGYHLGLLAKEFRKSIEKYSVAD